MSVSSDMPDGPCAGDVCPTCQRIGGLYSQRESRRKSPDRERWSGRRRVADWLSGRVVAERLGAARQIVDVDAGKRGREGTFGLGHRGAYNLVEQRGACE